MPILKIARMGHPVLRGKAAPVQDPRAPDIRRLAADMLETMEDANGAGLAAPQVHVPLRLVMFHVPAHRTTEGEGPPPQGLTILTNPVIEPLDEEKELGWEGCLSLPGMLGAVPRFKRIRYRGLDLDGNPIEREASGFHARVVQHECDHLDGILYPQRMEDLSLFGFADDMRKSFTELSKAEEVD
jgi:peptide deformylase